MWVEQQKLILDKLVIEKSQTFSVKPTHLVSTCSEITWFNVNWTSLKLCANSKDENKNDNCNQI